MLHSILLFIPIRSTEVIQGASIKEAQPATFGFYYDQMVSKGRPHIELDIFVCEDQRPPMYRIECRPLYFPETDCDYPSDLILAAVKKHAELTANLTTVQENLLNKETRDGELFYKIDFDIEMALHSASLTFTVVGLRGITQQPVHIEFV